ncbi:longitudinals lacking isoforms a b d l [Lasius niger]|uniref:Longitudinals lacking isoforms a b d l n=1 Tax=Lasius niger TaxID=67767 RepID=A0A0J7NXY0_LASNI|nr:longitudinals lacking isoforms a b d l [Lasius niger]
MCENCEWRFGVTEEIDPPLLITQQNKTDDRRMTAKGFRCPRCGRCYKVKRSLRRHIMVECGKAPMHKCPYCQHRSKYRTSISKHVMHIHPNLPYP